MSRSGRGPGRSGAADRVEIRPLADADVDALGLITVASMLGTFLGVIPESDLDLEWTPAQSAANWHRALAHVQPGERYAVAEVDGAVVGFVWSAATSGRTEAEGRIEGEAEVRGLFVLPSRQGRGIGRRLLAHAAHQARAQGATSLLIGCIRENPSCGFYRHLGGVEAFRRPDHIDRYETEQVFFRWADASTLE